MSDAPAAVLASFVRLSTLADGTVRAIIDIEPKNRSAAFALFDEPGAALAVARITNEAAVAHDHAGQEGEDQSASTRTSTSQSNPLPTRRILPLAAKVALTCQEEGFGSYLRETQRGFVLDAVTELDGDANEIDIIAEATRRVLGIQSRREVVEGSEIGRQWLNLEADYHDWQRRRA